MAARFLTRTVVGLSLRPLLFPSCSVSIISFSAKTTLLSHHRPLFSLSTPSAKTSLLSHRCSFPPPVMSLSLLRQTMSSRSDLSPQVNELLDNFNERYKNMPELIRKEYDEELEYLLQKEDYSLTDVRSLQLFHQYLCVKRSVLEDMEEHMEELLGWFDKEILNAKEITLMLRKDLEIIIAKDNQDLVEELEDMFWILYDIHEKAIRAKVEPKDFNKPRYLKELDPGEWKANTFIVELNELLDWFDKETLEASDTAQKLRKEYKTVFANLLDLELVEFKDEDEHDDHSWIKCLEELKVMFWNLKKKQANAILAKDKANELADKQAQAAKFLYPFFVF